MVYAPVDVVDLRPGLPGDDEIGSLMTNVDELYEDMLLPVLCVGGLEVDTTNTSFVEVTRWYLRGMTDKPTIRVDIRWSVVASGTASAYFELDGGTDTSNTVTTSSTSFGWSTMTVTRTTTTDPCDLVLKMKHDTGVAVSTIDAITCWAYWGAPSGVEDSGYVAMDAQMYAANEPVNTEKVSRLLNNPLHIAQDRFNSLVSLLEDEEDPMVYKTDSSSYVTVARFAMANPDPVRRDFRIDVYQLGTSTAVPASRVVIGGISTAEASGEGLKTATMELPGPRIMQPIYGRVDMKVDSGSGEAVLVCLQIRREPETFI